MSGWLLIAGSVLPVVIMMLHPTGADRRESDGEWKVARTMYGVDR